MGKLKSLYNNIPFNFECFRHKNKPGGTGKHHQKSITKKASPVGQNAAAPAAPPPPPPPPPSN